MLFGIPTAILLELGSKGFNRLFETLGKKRASKEFMALLEFQLEEAEILLGQLVEQINEVLNQPDLIKEVDINDLKIHNMQLAMIKNRIDRIGNMVRSSVES